MLIFNFNLVKDNTVGSSCYLHVIITPGQTNQSKDILMYRVSQMSRVQQVYVMAFEERLLHGMEGQSLSLHVYILYG